MSIPAQLLLASLTLNLFVLAIHQPDATSRPVRAEATVEMKLPLNRRCCGVTPAGY